MLKTLITAFILIQVTTFVSAQEKPDWVENKGFSPWISENDYVTGFGIAVLNKKDDPAKAKQFAEENAKKNLTEKIRVHVKSKTLSHKQQSGYYNFEQKLESEIISITDIELLGLKKEFYSDKKNGFSYCFVYVPKTYLIKSYEFKIFEKNKELENLFYSAQEYEKSAQKSIALEYYLKCSPILSAISDLQTVLLGLGKIPGQQIKIESLDLSMAINRLVTTINSLNDLAFFIAYAFKEQTQNEELKGVIVSPLTYRNTGMASSFSKQFRESVENQLVIHNKWETYPIKKYDPTIENMSKIRFAVKGNYWEIEEKININIYLYEILTGIKKACIVYEFDRNLANEEFTAIKPKNFEKAKEDQDLFKKDEIESSGLLLDVYTNKGQDDLIFTDGEQMKVYIKTNLPCYIQMIYHLSDSSRILSLNNEFIDVSQVNKVYELPFVFICKEPFGVETLQVNASEQPFPEIRTHNESGLKYIDEDLSSILKKTRQTDFNILQAEKRLTITTMPN